jgi:hypothetical protein
MKQLNAIQIEVLHHALAGITEEMMVIILRRKVRQGQTVHWVKAF